MSARIHGSEHPIQKIFSDDFAFTIPLYQRPYSWATEQAEELLNDLLEALPATSAQVQDGEPYFLGSIVLIKQDGQPPSEVIDGQQRLTTLTILFAAMRDTLRDLGYAGAGGLNKYLFQEGDAFTGTPDRPRLSIRERDNGFFRQAVQDASLDLSSLQAVVLSDPQRNILENYNLFCSRLKALGQETCLRLSRYILTNCFLVAVSTPNMESAYRIFSVMNDRGMDLSYTDILKSEIIGAIPEVKREAYTQTWESTEEALGRASFENLFSHLRTVFRKLKAQDTLLKEIRTFVRPQDNPAAFMDDTLKPHADAYRIIRNQEYEATHGAEAVNELTGWLSRIDNEDWVPPALAYFVRHRNNPVALTEFFRALERLAAVMMVIRADVNKRISRYAEVLGEIETGEAVTRSGGPMDLRSGEMERALTALNADMYNAKKINRYVLLRLDSALSGAGATYDHKIITIEHVLPQNPKPGSLWLQWFPEADEREAWTHRLGNLVLLSKTKNSQAGNYEFDKKKTTYFQGRGGVTPFALTSQVTNAATWTPQVLQQRQQESVAVLARLWGLQPQP